MLQHLFTASTTPLPGLGRWLCVTRFPGFCLFGGLFNFDVPIFKYDSVVMLCQHEIRSHGI